LTFLETIANFYLKINLSSVCHVRQSGEQWGYHATCWTWYYEHRTFI